MAAQLDDGGERAGGGFRPDVEGLRAVAVGLVVLYHAGVAQVRAGFVGVDVFFVISGFLITGLLLRELRATGTISLPRFYARRARRLLPLAALVLVATLAATWALLPPLDREGVADDVTASALYVANWHFAAQATDYLAEDVAKSPVLHWWSLAVEEQFYVVWPALLVGLALLGRRAGRHRLGRRVALALVAIGGASLLWSALRTSADPPLAYYGLHTRAWELAAGAALAVAGAARLARIPARVATVAGLAGVAAIAGSALLIDPAAPFPGIVAVVPVLGTALVIAAGSRARPGIVSRALATAGPMALGRISYAWYLWHWPCLTIARARWGTPDPETGGPGSASATVVALALALSLALAIVSHVVIEQPVRRARRLGRRTAASLALGAVLTLVPVAAARLTLLPDATALPEAALPTAVDADADAPAPASTAVRAATGASTAAPAAVPRGPLTVAPARARADRVVALAGCNQPLPADEVDDGCVFGDPDGAETIVLVGDSHAVHWFPALDAIARERGARLVVWTKDSCPFVDVRKWSHRQDREYGECYTWRERVLEHLRAAAPVDLLLIGRSWSNVDLLLDDDGARVDTAAAGPLWAAGAQRTAGRLAGVAARTVVLRDIPSPGQDVPRYISDHLETPWACDFPRADGVGRDAPLAAGEDAAGFDSVDLSARICPGDPCPVTTDDGRIIYRDDNHLTASYAASLAGDLAAALFPAA